MTNRQTVWRCGRCGHPNDPGEVSVLWDDDNGRWFQVGDKYGCIEPKCGHCLANIYMQPDLMGQLYRLESIEMP